MKAWSKGLTKETDRRLLDFSIEFKGRHFSPATEFKKGNHNRLGAHQTVESRLKMSISAKGKILSTKTRKLLSENNPRYWLGKKRPDIAKLMSIISKGNHNHLGFHCTEHTKRLMSINLKERWKNPSYREKQIPLILKGLLKRPTKLEMKFVELAQEQDFPLKYVGNGSVIINGANPDFICNDGRKLLIEVACRIWHPRNYAKQRYKIFSKEGYETLVIWEDEFKNKDKLLKKIQKFLVI
jgi:very-short-patch-repair endonuclease